MKPMIRNYLSGGPENTLSCPFCNCDNLHQISVDIFQREEDAENGQHIFSTLDGRIIIDDKMDGNPSDRRQGLFITLECEFEKHQSKFAVIQHKGNTYFGFCETRFVK